MRVLGVGGGGVGRGVGWWNGLFVDSRHDDIPEVHTGGCHLHAGSADQYEGLASV